MIYLDYAASAPPYPQVADRVYRVMTERYANPGSLHTAGMDGRAVLQDARRSLARLLNVREQEIFFTSGGTEANNWAVKMGCVNGHRKHIVVSAIEHKSVLESVRRMEAQGYRATLVYPDRTGVITPQAVAAALRPDTALLCVQAVNNETGVIQDVEALASLTKKNGTRFLCDGVQSFGHTAQKLNKADFISLSAHKLGGPRGVGCLVVRYPHTLSPLLDGGGQELGGRSGTENTPGIAGFGEAAEICMEALPRETARLEALSRLFWQAIHAAIPTAQCHGIAAPRHPGIVNITFPGISSEELVVRLDTKGICASPGAACAARDPQPSHVLLAMGLTPEQAKSSVRFSFGWQTTHQEVLDAAQAVIAIVYGK